MGLPLTPLSCSAPEARWGLSCTLLAMYLLVSHLLQNSARTNSQNTITSSLHLLQIITFVTNVIMRLILTFVSNWRCFKFSYEDRASILLSAVFAFEADDCGWLVG